MTDPSHYDDGAHDDITGHLRPVPHRARQRPDSVEIQWWQRFDRATELLDDDTTGESKETLADCLGLIDTYLPCARRGTHQTLGECWACWSDVARGAAEPDQVLKTRG